MWHSECSTAVHVAIPVFIRKRDPCYPVLRPHEKRACPERACPELDSRPLVLGAFCIAESTPAEPRATNRDRARDELLVLWPTRQREAECQETTALTREP